MTSPAAPQGFDDKSAYAQCIFAFAESPDSVPLIFSGEKTLV